MASSSSSSSSSSSDSEAEEALPTASLAGAQLDLDLGLLAAFDASPDGHSKEAATACVQALVDGLFALPAGSEGTRRIVALPPPITRMPRQKPLPKPKADTKWEAFAKSKGINNKKRERMVYDEAAQDWKPRFGSQRSQSYDPPILELKQTDPVDLNPFEREKTSKKLNQLKQKQRTLKNKERAAQKDLHSSSGIEGDVLDPGQKLGKKRTHEKLKVAQVSTASYGRFDREHKGEPKRAIGDKRRKFASNVGSSSDERTRNLKLLDRL